MKNILELTIVELKEFLLKEESYFNFDFPLYFSVQPISDKIEKSQKGIYCLTVLSIKSADNTNLHLLFVYISTNYYFCN
jgi:hypothetical protein